MVEQRRSTFDPRSRKNLSRALLRDGWREAGIGSHERTHHGANSFVPWPTTDSLQSDGLSCANHGIAIIVKGFVACPFRVRGLERRAYRDSRGGSTVSERAKLALIERLGHDAKAGAHARNRSFFRVVGFLPPTRVPFAGRTISFAIGRLGR